MRTILRAGGRTARVFLWIVKGLLLVLAVGAAVMWPASRGWQMGVIAERYRVRAASAEDCSYFAQCWDGRACVGRWWLGGAGGQGLAFIRAQVESGGDSWRWERQSSARPWDEGFWPSRWGPLRWGFLDNNDWDWTVSYRGFAAPLWGVSLAAGAWPLASVTLLFRRRRKRRRLVRVGCCLHCGYDLRATAEKDGSILARCPECGTESAAVSRRLADVLFDS